MTIKKLISSAVLAAVVFCAAGPLFAGPLASDPNAYNDGSTTWHGSSSFSDPSDSLSGYVDWAVYSSGQFPGAFSGYTATNGEFTYAYQVYVNNTAPVSSFEVGIITPDGIHNIGAFTGGGVNGMAPSSMQLQGSPVDDAKWTFNGGIANTLSSAGLAFSTPVPPANFIGSVVDHGGSADIFPLPSPFQLMINTPEPSTFVLAAFGLGALVVALWRKRRS